MDSATPVSEIVEPSESPQAHREPIDNATDMEPQPQPTGPTSSQVVMFNEADFKMYKEIVVVEI
jgi:hypothetical protein